MNPITPRLLADIGVGMLLYFVPRVLAASMAATFVLAGLWAYATKVIEAFTG